MANEGEGGVEGDSISFIIERWFPSEKLPVVLLPFDASPDECRRAMMSSFAALVGMVMLVEVLLLVVWKVPLKSWSALEFLSM